MTLNIHRVNYLRQVIMYTAKVTVTRSLSKAQMAYRNVKWSEKETQQWQYHRFQAANLTTQSPPKNWPRTITMVVVALHPGVSFHQRRNRVSTSFTHSSQRRCMIKRKLKSFLNKPLRNKSLIRLERKSIRATLSKLIYPREAAKEAYLKTQRLSDVQEFRKQGPSLS